MTITEKINDLISKKCSASVYNEKVHAFSVIQIGSSAEKYGDMGIVRYSDRCIAIDGGFNKDDASELRNYSFSSIIISHWHKDHFGVLCHINDYGGKVFYGGVNTELGKNSQIEILALNTKAEAEFIGKPTNLNTALKIYPPPQIIDEDENSCSLISTIETPFFKYFSLADTTTVAFNPTNFPGVFEVMKSDTIPIIKLPHHGSIDNNLKNTELLPYLSNAGIFTISGYGGNYCHETITHILKSNDYSIVVLLTKNKRSKAEIFDSVVYKNINMEYKERFAVASEIIFDVDQFGLYRATAMDEGSII